RGHGPATARLRYSIGRAENCDRRANPTNGCRLIIACNRLGATGKSNRCATPGLRLPVVWVGGVDVPSELVDAHRAGRLVLFVGAGASRDDPSGLPDFRRLTEAIADEAHYTLSDGEILDPDVVLGRIEDQGV